MAKNNVTPVKKDEKENTKAYTYEVKLVIQVLSDSEEKARKSLDENGGYFSGRDVALLNVTELPIKA